MTNHFLRSRASAHLLAALEANNVNSKPCTHTYPPLPPLPPFFVLPFIAEQASYSLEYHFGHFGPAVLAMSPPKIQPNGG